MITKIYDVNNILVDLIAWCIALLFTALISMLCAFIVARKKKKDE